MADDESPKKNAPGEPHDAATGLEIDPKAHAERVRKEIEDRLTSLRWRTPIRRGGSVQELPAEEFELVDVDEGEDDVVIEEVGEDQIPTDPFVRVLTGAPPVRAPVSLASFPDRGHRHIETLIIDRPRGLDASTPELLPPPPLPVRPQMILTQNGSVRPAGESMQPAPNTDLLEEIGRVADELASEARRQDDVVQQVQQVPPQLVTPAIGNGLPTISGEEENREEEEVVLATIQPPGPTPTPQGASDDPRGQPQSPPTLPGAGKSGGGGNTPPPKHKDHDRPKRSWGWSIVTHVTVAVIVFLFMRACAMDVAGTVGPQGYTMNAGPLRLFRSVDLRLPDAANREITLEAQTSTTVQSKSPQNLTVRCVPMGDHQVVAWVIPGHDKLISAATHPDLRKEVAPAPFVLVKMLPASCRNADGNPVDFQALKVEVAKDPDAQQYVEALAERCMPKPNRGQTAPTPRRDVTAGTDASARMSTVAGCDLAAKPGFAPWSSPRIGEAWDAHVRAQGKAFGTWCATCYDAPRCVRECQKAGSEFGLEYNDPARFGDECRAASRQKAGVK